MAIIPDVPGLEVEIVVKCTPLHEYVDQDEEGSAGTVTRYIEAVSGAEFAVQYRFSPDFEVKHALGIHVHVDGKNIASRVLKTRDRIFYGGSDLITGARSKEGGSFYISKFCFAALNIGIALCQDLKAQLTDSQNSRRSSSFNRRRYH